MLTLASRRASPCTRPGKARAPLAALVLVLAGGPAHAQKAPIDVPATETGKTAAVLANGTISNPIAMIGTTVSNQLALTYDVVPGTSLVFTVQCYERGSAAEAWQPINLCDSAQPTSSCVPDKRQFTLANYTADGNGHKWITSRWGIKKAFAACLADDPADGNGTYTLTGQRSWQ